MKNYITSALTDLRKAFETGKRGHSHACRSAVLGALYLDFRQYGIFGGAAEDKPCLSIVEMLRHIRERASNADNNKDALRHVEGFGAANQVQHGPSCCDLLHLVIPLVCGMESYMIRELRLPSSLSLKWRSLPNLAKLMK